MSANHELGVQFAESHPEDAARVLERAAPQEVAAFLAQIPTAAAAETTRQMNIPLAAAALSALETTEAARIVQSLPPYHAVHLLRHLDPDTAQALLGAIEEKAAMSLRRLLRYREGSAGALADPQVLTLPSDISAGEAQKHLRRLAGEVLYNIYVTDRDHHLVGVLTIRALLLARPKQKVDSIMERQLIRLPAALDLASVAGNPAWLQFDTLPVVDKADVFLGVIRHKTIRQLAEARVGAPGIGDGIDVALRIADMYWKSVSTLVTGLATAAIAQPSDGEYRSRR